MSTSATDNESSVSKAHTLAELAINNLGSFFPSPEVLDTYVSRSTLNPTEKLESIARERQHLLQRHAHQKAEILSEQKNETRRTQAFYNGAADQDNFSMSGKEVPKEHDPRALAPTQARNEVNLLWADQGRCLARVIEMQQKDLDRLKSLKNNVLAEIQATRKQLDSGRFPTSEWEFDLVRKENPERGAQIAQYLSIEAEEARKIWFMVCQRESPREWDEAAAAVLKALYDDSKDFRVKILNIARSPAIAVDDNSRSVTMS